MIRDFYEGRIDRSEKRNNLIEQNAQLRKRKSVDRKEKIDRQAKLELSVIVKLYEPKVIVGPFYMKVVYRDRYLNLFD